MPDRCHAETRIKRTHYGEPHTYRCQKDSGHDGAHEWADGATHREVIWYGEARRQDENNRHRFGVM